MTDRPNFAKRGELIKFWSKLHPDRPVVICGDQQLTWTELRKRSKTLARGLHGLGLRPGDRACVMIYNLPQFWEITGAMGILGVGIAQIGYKSQAPEIEYVSANSDAKALVFYHEFADRILPRKDNYPGILPNAFISVGGQTPAGARSYDELMADPPEVDLEALEEVTATGMIYTSGTTGKPKGAYRGNLEKMAGFMAHLISQFKYDGNEVHLVSCPLYHSAPIAFSGAAFAIGGTMVLMPKFDPIDFLENVSKHGVTSAFVVPTILDRLLQVPDERIKDLDLGSLRALICGAAPLFPRIKHAIMDRFGPVLYEFYGSTETSVNTILKPEDMAEKAASVGKPFPDNELLILDAEGAEVPVGERGELFIKNPNLIDSYYKNEQASNDSRRGEFFSVGDVAVRDEDGYYYIVDRIKDMIIRGGVNVYPAEIEDELHGMDGVRDVAVVGVPDDYWGEVVAAFVVLEDGADLSAEAIKEYCGTRMASHKVPATIVFTDEVPRSPQGKILKRELRERVKDEREAC